MTPLQGRMSKRDLNEFLAIVTYDPETGKFLKSGEPCGHIDPNGYRRITIRTGYFFEHRLAFPLMGQPMPKYVDHINGIRADNRWENLRAATWNQNQHNRRPRKDNKSGVRGVSWHKNREKWQVSVMVNGKQQYFGLYADIKEAELVARAAREKLHKEYCCHE